MPLSLPLGRSNLRFSSLVYDINPYAHADRVIVTIRPSELNYWCHAATERGNVDVFIHADHRKYTLTNRPVRLISEAEGKASSPAPTPDHVDRVHASPFPRRHFQGFKRGPASPDPPSASASASASASLPDPQVQDKYLSAQEEKSPIAPPVPVPVPVPVPAMRRSVAGKRVSRLSWAPARPTPRRSDGPGGGGGGGGGLKKPGPGVIIPKDEETSETEMVPFFCFQLNRTPIRPYHPAYAVWRMWVSFTDLTYLAIVVPITIGMRLDPGITAWQVVSWLAFLTYFAEMCLGFVTAYSVEYRTRTRVVNDYRSIAWYQITRGSFFYDICAVFPLWFGLISLYTDGSNEFVRSHPQAYIEVLSLIRLIRVFYLIKMVLRSMTGRSRGLQGPYLSRVIPVALMRFCQAAYLLFVLVNFVGCFWHYLAVLQGLLPPDAYKNSSCEVSRVPR